MFGTKRKHLYHFSFRTSLRRHIYNSAFRGFAWYMMMLPSASPGFHLENPGCIFWVKSSSPVSVRLPYMKIIKNDNLHKQESITPSNQLTYTRLMTFSPVSVLFERFWREKSHKLMVFLTLYWRLVFFLHIFFFDSAYRHTAELLFPWKKCSRMYLKINRSGKNAVTWA